MVIETVWPVAAIVVGFQLAGVSWRIQREISMREKGELVWLPPVDWLNLTALVITVAGVFVAPSLDLGSDAMARHAFALALILLGGYPFALAGHYGLINMGTVTSSANTRGQTWATPQERGAIALTMMAALIYVLVASFS